MKLLKPREASDRALKSTTFKTQLPVKMASDSSRPERSRGRAITTAEPQQLLPRNSLSWSSCLWQSRRSIGSTVKNHTDTPGGTRFSERVWLQRPAPAALHGRASSPSKMTICADLSDAFVGWGHVDQIRMVGWMVFG